MTYNSFDTIPIKLFFKIQKTGDLSLLSDEKSGEDLSKIWQKIEQEHDRINPNKSKKEFDLFKQIEAINSKYQAVKNAVHVLSYIDDEEMTELLKGYGYTFTGDSQNDLEKILNHCDTFRIKIKKLREQLPKPENKKEVSIDEVILGYSVIAGSGFVNTNKITGSQYYALISIGNQKMKALENGKQ